MSKKHSPVRLNDSQKEEIVDCYEFATNPDMKTAYVVMLDILGWDITSTKDGLHFRLEKQHGRHLL